MEPTPADPAAPLVAARRALGRAALDAPLLPAERAFLAAVAGRLEAMAARIREDEGGSGAPAGRSAWTRREAARLIGVHPNTLLSWERRGLLVAPRDRRGWRVYGRDELAVAQGLVAGHHPGPTSVRSGATPT